MSQFDDLLKTGDEILNEVNKAVSTGNYSNLGDSIRVQVKDAVDRAAASTGQNFSGRASADRNVMYSSRRFRPPFFAKKISASKGIGKIIGGIIGTAYLGFWSLICIIASIAEPVVLIPAVISILLTALCAYLIKVGVDDRKLTKAFYKYGRILGNSEYFAVNDLAFAANENPDIVKKNIKKMLKKEFLPTARFDTAESTVMLTPRAIQQYMNAEASRLERERDERMNQTAAAPTREAQNASNETSEVNGIVKEGNEYIANIRRINDLIPGDEMSAKLYQLENIMRRIFNQVEKEPDCADDLRKFMNYYLPTTTKLLNAYVDLDRQPEVGSNITQTKKEIEDAIDVINNAFENLLDSLFQDMAWDISSDISVMKTMMAQDGLTDDSIRNTQIDTESAQLQQAQPLQGGQAAQAAPQMAQAQAAPQTELKF